MTQPCKTRAELTVTLTGQQPIFLNLSNHPSQTWTDPQIQSARALHKNVEIIDIPFPQVDPTLSTQDIIELAEQEWTRIANVLNQNDQRPLGAMVSGEPILCILLVRILQQAGITCYCATTQRVSSTDTQGIKHSVFSFVRFREWPLGIYSS